MMRTVRHTLLAAGTFVVMAAAVWPHGPGLTFTIRTTNTADTAEGRSPAPSSTRVRFLDGALRFDADEAADGRNQAPYGKGSYWLVNASERSMTVVMPERRQYYDVRFDSTAGILMQAMAANTVITDIQVSGSALGSGGVVNGYPTKRYRITTSYTEATSDDAESKPRKMRADEEFWVTDALKDVPDPMEAFTRAFGGNGAFPAGAGVGTMNELMQKRGDAQRKLFKGLPMRTVVKSTQTDAEGRQTEETSTTEIADLTRVDLDPGQFRVPDGYSRVDLSALIMSAAKDAAKKNAKASAKETATEGAKEAAKEAAKGAIKGIFGKRKKP